MIRKKEIKINNPHSASVSNLIGEITGPKNSLYADAKLFFKEKSQFLLKKQTLLSKIEALSAQSAESNSVTDASSKRNVLIEKLAEVNAEQEEKRLARLSKALSVCDKLLALIEGETIEESQVRSAKVLGTILLLSPGKGKNLSRFHQQLKPFYKAVLSYQFIAKLDQSNSIRNAHITNYSMYERPQKNTGFQSQDYTQAVILPILFGAIFQDVGMLHPSIIQVLEGTENNKLDPFRVLEVEERDKMLKLNFKYTLLYLRDGLGAQKYKGNSTYERSSFDNIEAERLSFQQNLIGDGTNAKQGIAEILKVPQIYTSVVLSSKQGYKRSDLPKAAILLEQMAVKKIVSTKAVSEFVAMVGYFPQGYGICYIPEQSKSGSTFEYAVVNRLYPPHKQTPYCKRVSRKGVFIATGNNLLVSKPQNLHFADARKSVSSISPERFTEIMGTLSRNFKLDKGDMPIPEHWEPHDMFVNQEIQNLWTAN